MPLVLLPFGLCLLVAAASSLSGPPRLRRRTVEACNVSARASWVRVDGELVFLVSDAVVDCAGASVADISPQ